MRKRRCVDSAGRRRLAPALRRAGRPRSAPSCGPPATPPRPAAAPAAWRRLVRRGKPGPLPLPRRRLRDRHASRVPALVPPALRPARAGSPSPRSATTSGANRFTRLLPVLGRQKGRQAAALVEDRDRRLGDPRTSTRRRRTAPARRRCAGSRSAVAGPGDCRIAFWHRPRYSEGAYGGAPDLNPFWHRLVGRAQHRPQRARPQPAAAPPPARHHAVRGGRRRPRALRPPPRRPVHAGLGDGQTWTARSAWC